MLHEAELVTAVAEAATKAAAETAKRNPGELRVFDGTEFVWVPVGVESGLDWRLIHRPLCYSRTHEAESGFSMSRYKNRKLQFRDLVPRFESEPSSTHVRNALAAIDHLCREGTSYWDEGSSQLQRWREGCAELANFMNRLGERREAQCLPIAFREFIQEFEHSTGRMLQMLHSPMDAPHGESVYEEVNRWCELIYRNCTYALVSFWIDDKTEGLTVRMTINVRTGKTTMTTEVDPMQVPKKYRRATVDI